MIQSRFLDDAGREETRASVRGRLETSVPCMASCSFATSVQLLARKRKQNEHRVINQCLHITPKLTTATILLPGGWGYKINISYPDP